MRKNWISSIAVASALFGVAAIAQAANTDRYGMGGCGLGSLLFGDEPGKVSQVLAATTNGTFGTQTFGITTGTSNCDPKRGSAGARLYIETNREALAKDAARGSGETLAGLSSLAGCRDADAVGSTLQRNFGVIFPHAGVPDALVSSAVFQVLQSEASLACDKLQ